MYLRGVKGALVVATRLEMKKDESAVSKPSRSPLTRNGRDRL
jgi:hypothetical protein